MEPHTLDSSDDIIYPALSAKKKQKNKLLMSVAGLVLAISALVVINLSNTQTQGVGTYRNWNEDSIIQGGAITEKELLDKYDKNASGVQSVFGHYGIARSDLIGKTSTIKHGVVHQDGSVYVGNEKVATDAYSVSRLPFSDSRGNAPKKVTINGTTFYEGPNMSIFVRSVDAFVFFRNGQFYRAVISSCANPVVAVPIPPKPTPVYACTSLTAEKRAERTRFRFTANATAHSGAVIDSYTFHFGDGTTKTSKTPTIEHNYTKADSYTAKVVVTVLVNGKATIVPESSNCEARVVVAEEPKVAVYACDSLTSRLIQSKERTFRFTVNHTAEGGAKLTKIIYNFGDDNSKTRTDAAAIEHQFAKPGTYTTTATLYFTTTENGKAVEKRKECTTQVTIAKPDNCPLPGKEHLPKNSPDCTEPLVETPPELPQTGLAEWFAGGAGLAALAAALYYWNTSRKNLEKAMLKK